MKIKIIFISLFSLLLASVQVNASAIDSVGVKVIDGKSYIIHKVEPKETLYSLGKRYHVSVAEIQQVNPLEKDGYKIDQIGRELLIPYKKEEFASSTDRNVSTSKQMKHTVEAGETIYSISIKYGVSQDEIMSWNDLQSTTLDIGQVLLVSEPKKLVSEESQKEEKKEVGTQEEIIHIVDLGETIYSISKQYDVMQSQIIELNHLKDNNIAVGQKLIIKTETKVLEEEKVESETLDQNRRDETFHNAKEGETYEKIAEMYEVKVSQLKKWNKFKAPFRGGEVIKLVAPQTEENKITDADRPSSNNVSDNQSRVHTVKSGETLYSLSEKYNVEVEDLRRWNSLNNYQLSLGQKLYIQNPDALMADVEVEAEQVEEKPEERKSNPVLSENPQKQDTKAYFTVEEDDMPKINKIKEKGVAEVIEGSEGTEKYLALHRTAKIGTIMQVRNDLNDQIVFVRVLGKLPNTGVDKKVIIRISKKAFEKLGGVDYKFPVEISYLPLKD